ncbi:MAG: flagellin [Hyphomonadaceae bacterium]|nr:flagellin [Hyphomonadaceae bacterium]
MTGPINTNMGALFALQNLTRTTRELDQSQTRISTGLRIGAAADNGAVFNVAEQLRADNSATEALRAGLNRALSAADVAMAAGTKLSDILVQMREKALSATALNLTPASRQAYNDEFIALRDEITQLVDSAAFDRNNLLNGGGSSTIPNLGTKFDVLANIGGTAMIPIPITDFRLLDTITPPPPLPVPPALPMPYGANQMHLEATSNVATPEAAGDMMGRISASLEFISGQLANIGISAKRVEGHLSFIAALRDSNTTGLGALVDTDYGLETARLQAAQIKQQLTTQSLSIANTAPQAILALLR